MNCSPTQVRFKSHLLVARYRRGGSLRFAGSKGYQTDDGTGMDLLGARYYIPALGRFLTQDPIGQEGGLNLYAYCGNSPLSRVDPDGTDWLDNMANFAGGWGKGLTFGVTGALSQSISRALGNGEFEYGGGYFAAGEIGGSLNSLAFSGGLSGGAKLSTFIASKGGAALGFAAKADEVVGVYTATRGGRVIYAGISNDIDRRAAEHAGRFAISQIEGLGNLTRAQAKSVEQALIQYHGLSKNGGTLLNSIARRNPIYGRSVREGYRLLNRAGYFTK